MAESRTEKAVCETKEFGNWLVMVDLDTGDFSVAELGPTPNRRHRRAAISWVHKVLNGAGFETSMNAVWLMFE